MVKLTTPEEPVSEDVRTHIEEKKYGQLEKSEIRINTTQLGRIAAEITSQGNTTPIPEVSTYCLN